MRIDLKKQNKIEALIMFLIVYVVFKQFKIL